MSKDRQLHVKGQTVTCQRTDSYMLKADSISHLLRHVELGLDVREERHPLSAKLARLPQFLVDETPDHGAADLLVDLQNT